MEKPESLIDDKTLEIFGTSSSLDVNMLIKNIELLEKHLPNVNNEKNFFGDAKKEFIISKIPQEITSLYKNVAPYFSDCINWKSPRTQFNITPPTIISAVATSALVNLINPNMVWDVASGGFAKLERDIASYLSSLVEWKDNSSGIFTFGGTGTDMYAIKIGINKADKNSLRTGVKGTYVISNDESHSCHINICNWLGIGADNCVRLTTSKEGVVDAAKVLESTEKILKENNKIACIILNGGTNFNGMIDPIFDVSKGIEELKKKYNLDYKPHIHADSVIGWVFLLFKGYDFKKNELNFPNTINKKLEAVYDKLKDISFADSFGVDFHKTGFCPYISSIFITRDKKDWELISLDENLFTHQSFNFGEYKPGQFTLETSRSANGPVMAYVALNALGIEGIQKILAHFLYLAEDLRGRINNSDSFENCNPNALGWATLFIVRNSKNPCSYDELYKTENETIITKSNKFQKGFYDSLVKKYNNKLPWNIGFAKCYKKNQYNFSISALKNYPMSPFTTLKDNKEFIEWLNKNLEEYKNENKFG